MALPKVDLAVVGEDGAPIIASPAPAEGLLQRGLQKIGTVDLGMGSVRSPRSPTASRTASSSYGVNGRRSVSPEAIRRPRRSSEEETAVDGDHRTEDEDNVDGVVDVPIAREEEETGVTDTEGWIYSDNKWEGAAPKNGIGKVSHSNNETWPFVLFTLPSFST